MKKPKAELKLKQVALRLSKRELKVLDYLAGRMGKSRSDTIRTLIWNHLPFLCRLSFLDEETIYDTK